MKKTFKQISLILIALLPTACATQASKQTTFQAAKWQQLGSLRDNGIQVSYDTNNIKRNGLIATLRERKTIITPQPAFAINGLPPFKTAESVWQFHCSRHTFLLSQLTLINEQGQIVGKFNYPDTPSRYHDIPMGTLAEKQFKIACAAPQ